MHVLIWGMWNPRQRKDGEQPNGWKGSFASIALMTSMLVGNLQMMSQCWPNTLATHHMWRMMSSWRCLRWHRMSRRTITAVRKRTHLVVSTNKNLYVRPANDNKQPVIRILLSDKADFLVEESRLKYDFYRKGGAAVPNEVQWELL